MYDKRVMVHEPTSVVANFEVGVCAIFATVGAVSLGGVSGRDSPSP